MFKIAQNVLPNVCTFTSYTGRSKQGTNSERELVNTHELFVDPREESVINDKNI